MSFEIIKSADGKPIKAWIKGVPVEEAAKEQLRNVSKLPFIYKHVVGLPDMHVGVGGTVGSVIATQGAIIPGCTGRDIGCGMIAQRTSLTASDLPDNLHAVRLAIEERIPHGRTDNGGENDKGAWTSQNIPPAILSQFSNLYAGLLLITEKHPVIQRAADRAPYQLGTLGTGNHFTEICLDEEQSVWVMLHSGSRGVGGKIGDYFVQKAKEEMERWFIHLPDKDLAYLPEGSDLFKDYCGALEWAQEYARINRTIMMAAAIEGLREEISKPFILTGTAIDCHHNYVDRENHFNQNVLVTRKGAVRARVGDWGIIPGSMGAQSFIVKGKGNPLSFHSCSHGAGRAMSRTEARRRFTVEDHIRDTEGIECRKDSDVIDETPKSYKDISAIMNAQSDLVEIVHTLRQVVNIKG